MKVRVVAYLLAPSGPIPNHPRWPLLVYPQAVPNPTPEAFEALFTRNGWPAAWRNGIFPFHHYHSNAHEALGVYEGEVTVQFGGEGGVEVQARPGDVIVLPAGTGHKKISSRGALGIVGAYPQGAKPDTCMPPFARKAKNAQSVLQVGLPRADPVLGGGRAALRALEMMHMVQRLMNDSIAKKSRSVVLGSGAHRYRVVENWAKLPDGWEFKDVAAVAVDSKDRVYVFNRGEHPMIVFDREGNFIRSWGEGTFPRAHGLHIDANDLLYCTDDGGHIVRKCTTEGKVLLELGVPGQAAPYMSGTPFHRCTHTALSPRGDIYVSDGYGNARVHKFSPGGKLVKSWGEPGTDPGQFNIVHNIVTDPEGWVYVADRENHRVQVFDGNGKYETQWVNMHRPCALYRCRGKKPQFVIGELGPGMTVNRNHPNIGPRLSFVDAKGKLIARLGGENGPGLEPGKFIAPHGLAIDLRGDIYVGEVSYTEFPRLFPEQKIAWRMRSLQKLEKLA